MTDMPTRASAVVIGAGIVGNSLVHHLAVLGWRDIVLVDKGPLPNPGGSTGHASNFIFPIEYSRLMFELTRDSTEQYKALGVFTESGGIEVARTPERMQELKRRVTKAKAWGIPAEHLTPEGVQKLVPYLDPSRHPRRRLLPHGRRRRQPARRDADARAGAGGRRADRRLRRRGPRHHHRGRAGHRGRHQQGRDRHGQRRDLLRRLVAQGRRAGRGAAGADPDRAPDDQRRPDRPVRRDDRRDLLPDRPRRGRGHVRAAARRRHGGRLLHAPADHRAAGDDPVQRGGGALADRAAVHRRRLRPAARRRRSSSCPSCSATRRRASGTRSTG